MTNRTQLDHGKWARSSFHVPSTMRWSHAGYPRVTPTTRRLLEHWADPERENRVLFCQRESAETAIYLSEVASRDTDVDAQRPGQGQRRA
ncbi:MAG: hypothetical protein ACRDRO_27740 [Pseudonocardiaceae bacterium]